MFSGCWHWLRVLVFFPFLSRFRNFPSRIQFWLVYIESLIRQLALGSVLLSKWKSNFHSANDAVEWWMHFDSVFLANSANETRSRFRWFTHFSRVHMVQPTQAQTPSKVTHRYFICTFDRPSENNNSFSSSSSLKLRSHIGHMCSIARSLWVCAVAALNQNLMQTTASACRARPIHTWARCRFGKHNGFCWKCRCWSVRHENIIYVRTGWSWKHIHKGRRDGGMSRVVIVVRCVRVYTCEHKMPNKQRSKLSPAFRCLFDVS